MISAYVMQEDLLYPMLTVEETLMFAAEFRLPRTLSHSKKKIRVEALIDQLGLRRAAGTIIGDEGHRGVSGGERRRVSIGIDIIHDPIILFLDEPTSGLDSTSAFMVVKVLQRIAQSGSIRQPRRFAPILRRFRRPIPDNENRTEFALDLIRQLDSDQSSGGTKPLVEFYRRSSRISSSPVSSAAKQSDNTVTLKDAISASISRGKLGSASVSRFANPFWTEMIVLTRRAATNSRRLPELFLMRLGAVLVTGFILATIFWRLDSSPKGLQERLGFFAIAMSTMFYTCADALPVFLQERYIFMRETAFNAYRRSSYVLSNTIVGLPAPNPPLRRILRHHILRCGLAGGTQASSSSSSSSSHRSGRKRLRHIPIWNRIPSYAGIHNRRRHFSLLPPLQRLLHHPRQNPRLLDLVPLPLVGEVSIRSCAAERVRRSEEVLCEGISDVRQHAILCAAGGGEAQSFAGH
ncbi:ABC transporter G family member 20 [Platanthera guangdongensis]|uniref:ABC transporter G family member 20 n=1 Tax=Platanthera guangdongensis TaxID=2320717 RepID=A0ABR2MDD5_9ASPA